ncbi:hypothetical protein OG785_09880 [Streptomyces sp. NBC_00006]|uniref:hypothetical protein n=1 Tax=unclassified Streptomyces TaxID=2593676 RepID=UPI0022568185|nr:MULTISPECIES: hypothetical protein [unclassified Streptomyces]MCX5530866.1 hypothetical protein [Streptomyces sp. NBC_00006]
MPRIRAAEIDLDVPPGAPREVPGRPALYALGTWSGGVIAVHGLTGRVYRLPERDDWDMADLLDDAAVPDDERVPDRDAGERNVNY